MNKKVIKTVERFERRTEFLISGLIKKLLLNVSIEQRIEILGCRDKELSSSFPELNIFIHRYLLDKPVREFFSLHGITEVSAMREIIILTFRFHRFGKKISINNVIEDFKGRNKEYHDISKGSNVILEKDNLGMKHLRCSNCITSKPLKEDENIPLYCPVCGKKYEMKTI